MEATMEMLAIINGGVFLLNIIFHVINKKWTGAVGWFCAFIWVIIYLSK